MYIHRPSNTVYLAHPRTASKSTSLALVQQLGFEKVGPHHRGIGFLEDRDYFDWDPEELTAFCSVRNHVDAIGSWAQLLDPKQITADYPLDVEDVQEILDGVHPYGEAGELYPLVEESDYVYLYEGLPESLNSILDGLGFDPVELPERNVSEGRPERETHEFTPSSYSWILDNFQREMRLYGYIEEGPVWDTE